MWARLRRPLPIIASISLTSLFTIPMVKSEVTLEYIPSERNRQIHKSCKSLNEPYVRPFYLPSSLSQVIWNVMFCFTEDINYTRELVKTPDGGQIAIDWAGIENCPDGADYGKVLVISHGLTGGSDMPYIKNIVGPFVESGYRVCVIHSRGLNKTPLLTPTCHYQNLFDDFQHGVEHVFSKFPSDNVQFAGLGTSFGACTFVKYAGILKEKCKFKGIVSVSNPYNIIKCQKQLGTLYERYLVQHMKDQVIQANIDMIKEMAKIHGINIDAVMKSKTLREFDNHFTKFLKCTVDEFYQDLSCYQHIPSVKVPTLCIHARDDYITPITTIPRDKCKENQNMIMVETSSGSHVSFFEGNFSPRRWFVRPSIQFFQHLFSIPMKKYQEQ